MAKTRSAEKSYPSLGPGRTYLWLAFGTTHFRECYRSNQIPLDSMVLALLPFCFISFTAMNNNILTDQINCTFNLSIHTLRSGVLFLGTRSQLMSVRVQSDVSWRVAVLVKEFAYKIFPFSQILHNLQKIVLRKILFSRENLPHTVRVINDHLSKETWQYLSSSRQADII